MTRIFCDYYLMLLLYKSIAKLFASFKACAEVFNVLREGCAAFLVCADCGGFEFFVIVNGGTNYGNREGDGFVVALYKDFAHSVIKLLYLLFVFRSKKSLNRRNEVLFVELNR